MERRGFLLGASALTLTGCSGGNITPQACPPGMLGIYPACTWPPPPSPPPPPPRGGWNIGPVIGGVQYSVGMPTSIPGDRFDFPVGPTNHVAYVTKPLSLAGKSHVRLEYTIVGSGPFKPTGGYPPLTYVCLHFQRNGDDWSGRGPYDGYRWWSNAQVNLAEGDSVLDVRLTRDAWVSVTNAAGAQDFAAAMNDPCCVGFSFGNADGKGHGVYAEAPGTSFVIHSYEAI
jgi:hypothetical protein